MENLGFCDGEQVKDIKNTIWGKKINCPDEYNILKLKRIATFWGYVF